jgi:hypothetical protein
LQLIAESLRSNPKLSVRMVRLYNTKTGVLEKRKKRPPLWPD